MAPIIAQREDLPALFEQYRQTGQGAEIGVYKGEFARQIMLKYQGVVHLVDPWVGEYEGLGPHEPWEQIYEACLRNMAGFVDKIYIKRGMSVDIAEGIADHSLDFAYIDADHVYESVRKDIQAWYPKIRPGGILSGHDYLNRGRYPVSGGLGVNRAVDEFVMKNNLILNLTGEDKWRSWWVICHTK